MKSPMRQRLNSVAASLQISFYRLVDILPLNITRILCLKALGSKVSWQVAINHGLQIRLPHRITIGGDVFVAEDVILDGRGGLTIGEHVSINSRVQIWTAQHDWQSPTFAYVQAPVSIGDHCWISASAIILPGVTIGEGAVVAAGSVVVADVDPWTLVGGVPAKKLRDRPVVNKYLLNARRNKVLFW
jgi:putative colanic acid biosynthesis acetyltransferase WcaF